MEAVQWVLPQHCSQVLFRSGHIPCALNMSVVCFHLFATDIQVGASPLLSHFIFANSTSPDASYLYPWDALKHT